MMGFLFFPLFLKVVCFTSFLYFYISFRAEKIRRRNKKGEEE